MVGWDVSVLQFLLRRAGFPPGGIDGVFGPGTHGAVRRLQHARGLAADGLVGPATRRALLGKRSVRSAAPRVRRVRYLVRPGDTLTAIAVRFGTTVAAVARANRLDPVGILPAGAVLSVPVSHAAGDVPALLDRVADRYGVSRELVRALAWQESGFQPHVVSPAGARGVMQVTPSAWEFVEIVLLGRRVPTTTAGNVEVGVAYLAHLLRRFGGDPRLAVGAYYQGERSVRRHGLFAETEQYVANVLALRGRV
jgi:soluble lytic murein transglycosylase-like protein